MQVEITRGCYREVTCVESDHSAHSNSQSQDIFRPIEALVLVNFSLCPTKLVLAAI